MQATTNQLEILDKVQDVIFFLKNAEDFNSSNNFTVIDNAVNSLTLTTEQNEGLKDRLYSIYAFIREV
jgi:hypothetical protein